MQASNSNNRDIELALSNWLLGARDRDGNRAKRVKDSKAKKLFKKEHFNSSN